MPESCTCGAKLPEDARFCHKCGKPQRDEPLMVEDEPAPLPPAPVVAPAPEPLPIGFQNRTAVWIALRVGVMAFLLSLVSGIFSVIWMVAGGYLCVYLYRRRTGERLSVINGAQLGWLTGIFGFVVSTIMFVAALNQPEFLAAAKQQLLRQLSEADANQMMELLRTPLGVGSVLLTFFFIFTLLPAFGGAVGAKLLNRE